MKKVLTFFLLFYFTFVSAQTRMRDYIVQMPDSVMPLLTTVNRADCVDFVEAGMEAKVTNRLGGTSELLTLTDDYALWQYTTVSLVETKLLPLADSTLVVCMVRTVLQPVPDSDIAFFDREWKPLPTSLFVTLPKPSAPLATLQSSRLSLSPDAPTLKAECRTESMEMRDVEAALVQSVEEIVFRWDEKEHFIR